MNINSSITSSHILQNSQTYNKTKIDAQEVNKAETIQENIDINTGIGRYHTLFGGGYGEYIDNNIDLATNLGNYLSSLSPEDTFGIMLITGFDELTVEKINKLIEDNPNSTNLYSEPRFKTKDKAINFYTNKIKELENGDKISGGDTTHARQVLLDLLKVFQDSQKQEQETNYIELGKAKSENV
jgi:hypothetical protein